MGSILQSLWNRIQQINHQYKEEQTSNVEGDKFMIDSQSGSSVDGNLFITGDDCDISFKIDDYNNEYTNNYTDEYTKGCSDEYTKGCSEMISLQCEANMNNNCQSHPFSDHETGTENEEMDHETGAGNEERHSDGMEFVPFPKSSIREDENRIIGGPVFVPPLYLQRYSFVADKLHTLKAESVVDIGCAECQISRYLADVPSVKKICLIDMDKVLLQRHKFRIQPYIYHYRDKRKNPLTIYMFHGDATLPDKRILGCDAVSMVEFIEHLYPDDLEKVSHMVFHELRPRIIIVTTPNFEFNQLFPDDGRKFRHADHKFEWTRQEFQCWCDLQCRNHGYSVTYSGIGDPPPESLHVGHCSQAAIFKRLTEQGSSEECDNCDENYTLIAEAVYPCRGRDDTLSPSDMLTMEVDYTIRELLKIEDYTDIEPDKAVLEFSKFLKYRAIERLCDNSNTLRDHFRERGFILSDNCSGIIVSPADYLDSEAFSDDEDYDEEQTDFDEFKPVTEMQCTEECWD